jgi:4-oxalocrotonate tautomerase family enzyme
MPIANVHVLRGHPRPVLEQLLREVAHAYADVLDAPIERVQVWITEVDPELYAIAGEPADEVLATGSRASLEIPLVRLVMMEGRTAEQVARAMASLTQVVAGTLGGDPERVRVEVQTVPPDHWGIGGVPASVKRRAEIEARRAAAG